MNNNSSAELIPFLRGLADSIENNNLLPTQLQHIGEFFMSYKFQENNNQNEDDEDEEFDSNDVVKFLTLGWYIYRIILDKQENKENEENPVTSTD